MRTLKLLLTKHRSYLAILLCLCFLTGCGAGTFSPKNHSPNLEMTVNGQKPQDVASGDPTATLPTVRVDAGNVPAVITCSAKDPDGDPVTVTWQGATGATTSTTNPISSSATVDISKDEVKVVSCTATDDRGGSTVRAAKLRIVSPNTNHPPAVTAFNASPETVQPGGSVSLAVSATDPDQGDQDQLTYEFLSDKGAVSQDPGKKKPVASLVAPADASALPLTVTVRVIVTDPHGASASAKPVQVTVQER